MKNALTAEFIGTFFLYLIIGLCVAPGGAGALTPIAVGLGLASLVYACGHHSKAHFNPATTIAYISVGTHRRRTFLPFFIAILAGALAAAYMIEWIKPEALLTVKPQQIDIPKAMLSEFAFTFALMWVIVNVAVDKSTRGNQFYGLAIGGIVMAGAYAVGPISLAALNPAVTLGLCINGFLPWKVLPFYLVAQSVAAIIAGRLFKSFNTVNDEELSGSYWN